MKQRGRPPSPGLLTPREEEVLALIREGRSNREIATELGISLQGVKYHVTEILGKLGVESREEAAVWDARPARRWAFLPLPAFASWAETLPSFLTPKLAMASFAGLAAAVLTGAVLVAAGGDKGAAPGLAALAPIPTPSVGDLCREAQRICMTDNIEQTEITTLEEAAGLASFLPRLPDYIPSGFDERTMVHRRPTGSTIYYPDGRSEIVERPEGPHNDEVSATYSHADGRKLAITQGYYSVSTTPWHETAPADMKGSIQHNGFTLNWFRGTPKPGAQWTGDEDDTPHFADADWDGDNGSITLFWTMSAVETGTWEVTPDGVRHDITRPLNYVIIGNGVTLDDLLKIAGSVLDKSP